MTRLELRERARAWCEVIGPRAAARKLGIAEGSVTKWCSQFKWPSPAAFERVKDYALAPERAIANGIAIAHGAHREVIESHGADTRLMLSAAALKTATDAARREHCMEKNDSIGLLNCARTADVVHGWTQARQLAPIVAVQVNMPSAQERAETDAAHKALDAIVSKLGTTPALDS